MQNEGRSLGIFFVGVFVVAFFGEFFIFDVHFFSSFLLLLFFVFALFLRPILPCILLA